MIRWGISVFWAGILCLCLAVSGQAQTTGTDPNYTDWSRLAERAEAVLDAARASTPALEDLREQLASARTEFSEAEGQNADRITTIRNQIEGLGPEPAEGQTEPAELAERRVQLADQLAEAQAPGLRAQEAFRRADGLIREIDTLIRERQTDQILELGPSPLDIFSWADAASAVASTGRTIWDEIREIWSNPVRRAEVTGQIPVALVFAALGTLLVLRGKAWSIRLSRVVQSVSRLRRAHGILAMVLSLGEIIVPFMGVATIMAAVTATGGVGLHGGVLLDALGPCIFIVLLARWLGGQVFSAEHPILDLPPMQLGEARFYATLLGLILGLGEMLTIVARFEGYSAEELTVLRFLIVVGAALILGRLSLILLGFLRKQPQSETDDNPTGAEMKMGWQVLPLIARAMLGVSIVTPIAALIGYGQAANLLSIATINTLGLLGLLTVLHRLSRQVYADVTGTDLAAACESLWPLLADFVFLAGAMPLLALSWGARVSDLTEIWTRFLEGVSIGGAKISPASFLTFAVVFVALFAVTRLAQAALRSTVLPKTSIDPGGQVALVSGLGYVGVMLAALIAITAAGIDLSNLALVAGALSIGIGFGLQTIVSNFVAGIILLIERPVSEGDWIEVNGVMGTVRDISVRSTRIETFDRTDVIVPNADLISGSVTNWTRFNLSGRLIVPVGVAYGSDTKQIEQLLYEIAEAHPMVLLNPQPNVFFRGFGADSLDFELRVILRDVNWMLRVHSDLNHEIARRFADENIEIPFAQRDVWLRNPEALAATSKDT